MVFVRCEEILADFRGEKGSHGSWYPKRGAGGVRRPSGDGDGVATAR